MSTDQKQAKSQDIDDIDMDSIFGPDDSKERPCTTDAAAQAAGPQQIRIRICDTLLGLSLVNARLYLLYQTAGCITRDFETEAFRDSAELILESSVAWINDLMKGLHELYPDDADLQKYKPIILSDPYLHRSDEWT